MKEIFKKEIRNGIEFLSFGPKASTKLRISYVIEDGKYLHKKIWPNSGYNQTLVISDIQNIEKAKWNIKSLAGARSLIVKTSTSQLILESVANPDKIRSFILDLKTGNREIIQEKELPQNVKLKDELIYFSAIPQIIYDLLKTIQLDKKPHLIDWKVNEGDVVEKYQIIAELNVPKKKYKYDDKSYKNIAIIRAPISGVIIEITNSEFTKVYDCELPQGTNGKFHFENHLFVIQPKDSNQRTGKHFTKPLADYCYFKFAKHRNGENFSPLYQLYNLESRCEPVRFNEERNFLKIDSNDSFEDFGIEIPHPSYLVFDAIFGRNWPAVKYGLNKGERVKKGDLIVAYKLSNDIFISIKSPVNGKILFIGETDESLREFETNSTEKYRRQGTIWTENGILREYENPDWNFHKTVAIVIQPEKNSNLDNHIEFAYHGIIKALQKLIAPEVLQHNPRFNGYSKQITDIIESHIQTIKKYKGKKTIANKI